MKFSVENLYNDQGVLNFEFIDNPDENDDLVFYEYAKELHKTKFKSIVIPFKFREDYDPEDNFMFSKQYDYETQINLYPHKKHNMYITDIGKEYALMVWKQIHKENFRIGSYEDLEKGKKFHLSIDTMKLKKEKDPFAHRFVGIVSLGYDNMQIHLGCIRGYTCETIWKHFDKFLLNESSLDKSIEIAYDKDLKNIDYELEVVNRSDCVFPF